MSCLSDVEWKAGLRAYGHIFVRHRQEHRESVIPASEEGAFISDVILQRPSLCEKCQSPIS